MVQELKKGILVGFPTPGGLSEGGSAPDLILAHLRTPQPLGTHFQSSFSLAEVFKAALINFSVKSEFCNDIHLAF